MTMEIMQSLEIMQSHGKYQRWCRAFNEVT